MLSTDPASAPPHDNDPIREMPAGLDLVRITPEFSEATVPPRFFPAHRVGPAVWGRLRVRAGRVRFVFEDDPTRVVELSAGEHVDIPPQVEHRAEPRAGARFVVEFYRASRD